MTESVVRSAQILAIVVMSLALVAAACEKQKTGGGSSEGNVEETDEEPTRAQSEGAEESGDRLPERNRMVEQQLEGRDISDERVLSAMRDVPRHAFVPARYRERAYRDSPLPIGHDQTISQPYIVAKMTQELEPTSGDKVLEIGTGSGYQAAVLAKLVDEVYSIEIVCELAKSAKKTLAETGYDDNVVVKCGDGYKGWPEHAPFDKIIVTAAPPEIPEALVEQLAPGGRMILPVGDKLQELRVVTKSEDSEVNTESLIPVRFVPMVRGDDTPK